MQIAEVVGQAIASIKHHSLAGWKLMLVQPIHGDGISDGDPFLAIDAVGSGIGARVIISSDGASARELVKVRASPVRWVIVGLCDQ
jgi:ethanolamine utilization protein EutN